MMPEKACKRESTMKNSDETKANTNRMGSKSNSNELKLTERETVQLEVIDQEDQRTILERAQSHLLAGLPLAAWGPLLAGYHQLLANLNQTEPLSLTTSQTSQITSNINNGISETTYSGNSTGTSPRRVSESKTPTAVAAMAKPEDLSFRTTPKRKTVSPGDLIIDDGIGSRDGTPADNESNGAQNSNYAEQFKQLYELSDDPERKDFLDDLFSFMQKRGTPVTRIPIMAKQVLDLYQLYKLVISHGGLVQVINKKLWREITKGLNLPPSITSAAFTLRTQYMKYLYAYECDREKLSSEMELQAAIDGNRREGRRVGTSASYNAYSQISPTGISRAEAGNANGDGTGAEALDEENLMGNLVNHPAFAAVYREHLALEAQRQLERSQTITTDFESSQHTNSNEPIRDSDDEDGFSYLPPVKKRATGHGTPSQSVQSTGDKAVSASLAAIIGNSSSTPFTSTSDGIFELGGLGMPAVHFKITGRGGGNYDVDSSLVVSMEMNGIMYQGILYAQTDIGQH